MRLPRPLLRSLLLCTVSLVVHASLAAASHVAPVLPISGSPNHSHEKFAPGTVFPTGNYSFYDFSGADLTNCQFAAGSDLTFANFGGATMTNATLAGCNLDNADFRGADLTGASLPCMGGALFQGAILTNSIGAGSGCGGCSLLGPNQTDVCTLNWQLTNLCWAAGNYRARVSGVVFVDSTPNGVLDHGEVGVPGASVTISNPGPPINTFSDSRGGYFGYATQSGAGTVTVSLPVGYILIGSPVQNFNTATCRSAQNLNFPTFIPVTPTVRSTFGRVKALYR